MYSFPRGETALHVACLEGHAQAVAWLLEQGAVDEAAHGAGWPGRGWAMLLGHSEVANMLKDRGDEHAESVREARQLMYTSAATTLLQPPPPSVS